MKTIYLEQTLNLLFVSGQQAEVQELVSSGVVKETKTGVKYLVITE